MTIRTRLTLWYSSLLATVIVVFAISLFSILNWTWRSQIRDNMRVAVEQTRENIIYETETGEIALNPPETLELISTFQLGVQIWDANQRLVKSSMDSGMKDKPFDKEKLGAREVEYSEIKNNKIHAYILSYPLLYKGKFYGTLQVLARLETLDASMERLVRIMIGVGIVALLLSFMVGSVIAGQALQPIDNIAQAATQITDSGDLSKRIHYSGPPDELGQLTATFNATLARLERLFLTQRRFVADVSHELRTPLTTLQGNLDLLRRYGNDPFSIQEMDSEVKRMTRLVGDLLLLAQADGGNLPLVASEVELGNLAFEVYRQSRVLAEGVELKLGTVDAVRVRGDEDRLKQLLLNLVSNAIKYTPAGGRVVIDVTADDGYAYLKVTDTGIGIPKEDLAHIFDRFYRVDKARSRGMGGTGLGLSIASWIAEAHGGQITAQSVVGKGSVFVVRLPSADTVVEETRPRLSQAARPWRRSPAEDAKNARYADSDDDNPNLITDRFDKPALDSGKPSSPSPTTGH